MTDLAQYRLVEHWPAPPAPTTGGCGRCGQPLKVNPDTWAWVDGTGSDRCPAAETLCERLCRPHVDAPWQVRCGICDGTGTAYQLHEPIPDPEGEHDEP